MQIHSFAVFVVVVAAALASAVQKRRGLPMGTNLPGRQNKNEWKEFEYPNVFPNPNIRTLRKPDSIEGNCNFTINFDESRCTGSSYRYKTKVIPWDDHSAKMIEGNVKFEVANNDTDYYARRILNVGCGFTGRLMLTDVPENNKLIGLKSVRLITSEARSKAWIDSRIDDELCQMRKSIAPVTFLYWNSSTPEEKNYIGETRGYENTLRETTQATDVLTFQIC